jgi:hypothetical protein
MLFNSWEFKIDNQADNVALRLATHNMIFTEIAEQKLRKEIDSRTKEEWTALYLRRAALISVNWLVLMGCISGVVASSVYKT